MQIMTPSVLAATGTRIRAESNGKLVADGRDVLLFRESPFKLFYYFREDDVDGNAIDRASAKTSTRKNGKFTSWSLAVGDRTFAEGAFAYTEPAEGLEALRGRIGFVFESMDRWLEEDEELLGHPRDPFTRIDVRASSERIEVRIGVTTVIDSRRPFVLTETGLPIRYYIPEGDVKWEYFRESETITLCPYKGRARYWSALVEGTTYADVIWKYPEPLQDAERVRNAVGLYHERIEVLVDGEKPAHWPVYFTK